MCAYACACVCIKIKRVQERHTDTDCILHVACCMLHRTCLFFAARIVFVFNLFTRSWTCVNKLFTAVTFLRECANLFVYSSNIAGISDNPSNFCNSMREHDYRK